MDYSANDPASLQSCAGLGLWDKFHDVPSTSSLHVPLGGEHISLPYVLSPLGGMMNNNVLVQNRPNNTVMLLDYSNNQPVNLALWDGSHTTMSIFGTEATRKKDIHNICLLISRIQSFLHNNPVNKDKVLEVFDIIAEQIHFLVNSTYMLKCDLIVYNKKTGSSLNSFIKKRFGFKNIDNYKETSSFPPKNISNSGPSVSVAISPTAPIPGVPPSLNNMVKNIKNKTSKPPMVKKSYAQASKANISTNIEDILHIKDTFSSLSADKVGKIIKAKNSSKGQKKPKINITTKGHLGNKSLFLWQN